DRVGFGLVGGRPVVGAPDDVEGIGVDHAQGAAADHGGDGTRGAEDLHAVLKFALLPGDAVALFDDGDAVEDVAVSDGAEKFEVLGVRPAEGLGGAGGATAVEPFGGHVGVVPDLLGKHASEGGEFFDRVDERADVVAGGELVVRALAGEQRPGAALPVANVRTAVFALSVAIVVVAAPARTVGGVDLEDVVDDFEGVDDQRVVGPADAVADELEEAAVDDLAGFKLVLLAGLAVRDVDHAGRDGWVVEWLAFGWRTDAHVVIGHLGQENARGGGGALVEMRFDPVGVVTEEVGELGKFLANDVRGAEQRGDDGRERRGAVAGVLLPALLLCNRSVADKEAGGAGDEWNDVKAAESAHLPESPGKDDGERDLVKLNARPVGCAVDPEVLREAAIGMLGAGEIDERAQRCLRAAAGEQRARGLNHVARPDQVIAAEVVVGLGGPPWDGGGGDEGAGVDLVLMREDDVMRDAHQAAAIGGGGGEALRAGGAMPLLDEAPAIGVVGRGERLGHGCERGVVVVAERDGDGEVAHAGDVDLAHDGDVAVQSLTEVPGHLLVLREVLIAVTRSDIAATAAREAAAAAERKRDAVLPGEDRAPACDIDRAGGVAGAAAIQMRGEQSVALEAREDLLVALDLDVDENDRMVRVGDELLGDGVAAAEVVGADPHGEGVGVDVVEVVLEVALLLVEEGLLVGEEELHVAGLGTVDGGVVELVQDAVRSGKPDAAGCCVSRRYGVFFAGGPARSKARSTEGRAVVIEPAVGFVQNAH